MDLFSLFWLKKLVPRTWVFSCVLILLTVSTTIQAQNYCGQDTNLSAKVTLSNLALMSEELDNAAWFKSLSTITANSVIAPDGTLTADRLVEAASSGFHGVYTAAPFISLSASTEYRWSAYVKAGERTWVLFRPFYSGAGYDTYFNLSTCTPGTNALGSTAYSYSVGNGWCYLSVKRTTVSAAVDGYHILYVATGNGTANYLGDITKGVYGWGMQVNATTSPPDYIATAGSAVTLGPVCASGTTKSPTNPSKCMSLDIPIYTNTPSQINMGR
jgi:hypothetical protein